MKGTVLPERRPIRRSYHLDLPQLYEVDPKRKRSGCIRRVKASSASLNASNSFLLLDIEGREAWAYSGREAGVTCRNLALSLAKMHVRDEFKEWTGHVYEMSEGDPNEKSNLNTTRFWELLGDQSPISTPLHRSSFDEPDSTSSPPTLELITISSPSPCTEISKLAETARRFDGRLLKKHSDSALFMDCGGGELYVWVGKDASDDLRVAAHKYAEKRNMDQTGSILTFVEPPPSPRNRASEKDDTKCVLFYQRFTQYGALSLKDLPPASPSSSGVSSPSWTPRGGSMTSPSTPPPSPSFKTVIRINLIGGPSLYRFKGKHINRLPVTPESLRCKSAAYLLVDYKRREVIQWNGSSCGVFNRNRAKCMGEAISHDELHQHKNAFFQINRGGGEEGEENPTMAAICNRFWSELGCRESDICSMGGDGVTDADDIENCVCTLMQLNKETDDEQLSIISKGITFDVSQLKSNPSALLFLDCGGGELYAYAGPEASDEDRERLRKCSEAYLFDKASSGAMLTIIQPTPVRNLGNESVVLWHQRWRQFGAKTALEVGIGYGGPSPGNSPRAVEVSTPRGITAEVNRMISPHVGSLRMEEQEVDDSMSGHALGFKLLEDDSATITGWKVADSQAKKRKELSFIPLRPSEVGIFYSDCAKALLVTMKNGARRVLYLWLGENVRSDHKAFLSLQSPRLDSNADQINIEQGREPPFLLMLLHKLNRTAIVLDRPSDDVDTANRSNFLMQQSILFAVEESTIWPGRGNIIAVEQDALAVVSTGLCPKWCYLLVNAKTKDGKRRTIFWPGPLASEELRIAAVNVGKPYGRLIGAMRMKSWKEHCYSSQPPVLLQPELKANAMLGAVKATCALSGANACSKQCSVERFLPGSGRPVRLFLVSHETRAIGAMFVREIGAGEVFIQADLGSIDSHVLDAGGSNVFVYHGTSASDKTRKLAVDVANGYIKALCGEAAVNGKDGMAHRLAEDRLLSGQCRPPVQLRVAKNGTEPCTFVWCFRSWKKSTKASKS